MNASQSYVHVAKACSAKLKISSVAVKWVGFLSPQKKKKQEVPASTNAVVVCMVIIY
jgi:hypothetical protein